MIRDNFLENYDWFRDYCDKLSYDTVNNEKDGVDYQGICMDVPQFIRIDILYKLQQLIGPITKHDMFLRLSLNGVEAPHGAHNDTAMGEYTMILYLNREQDCQGGTSLIHHKEHCLANDIKTEAELKIWERDTNHYCRWKVDEMIDMRPNRAVVFPSNRMHRAEYNNFGDNPINGRLILGCFFNVG